jgi:hypothetical protein
MQLARIPIVLLLGFLCAPGLCLGGAIVDKVVFAGAVPPAKKIDITIDQYVCGNTKDSGDLLLSPQKELRNAVVWLENAAEGPDDSGHSREAGDRAHQLRPPLLDGWTPSKCIA